MSVEKLHIPAVFMLVLGLCLIAWPDMVWAQTAGTGGAPLAEPVSGSLGAWLTRLGRYIHHVMILALVVTALASVFFTVRETVLLNKPLRTVVPGLVQRIAFAVLAVLFVTYAGRLTALLSHADAGLPPSTGFSVGWFYSYGTAMVERIMREAVTQEADGLVSFCLFCGMVWLSVIVAQAAMIVLAYAEYYFGTILTFSYMTCNRDENSVGRSTLVINKGRDLLFLLLVCIVAAQSSIYVAGSDGEPIGVRNLISVTMLQILVVILMLRLSPRLQKLIREYVKFAVDRPARAVAVGAALPGIPGGAPGRASNRDGGADRIAGQPDRNTGAPKIKGGHG